MQKKKSHKKRKSVIGRIFVAVILLCFLVCIGVFGYVAHTIAQAKPIDPSNIYATIERSSYMYDKDGNLIDTLYYTENRKVLPIAEMPDDLRNAFIAIEDKTFYEHHGFNYRRLIGAVWSYITHKTDGISGTSTITQQLARNIYLPEIKSERTVKRKIVEMYYAWCIEKTLSKDDILEAYLNTIYLGYGNYGINAAAKTYFSKKPEDLNLTECAALAALPQAPDEYALVSDEKGEDGKKVEGTAVYSNDVSAERRSLVLDLMAEQGYITQAEADEAKQPIHDLLNPSFEKPKTAYTYFSDYVVDTLSKDLQKEYSISEKEALAMIYTGGLNIYTTIDSGAQKVILDEFSNDYNFPYVYGDEEPQAAMVITEVGTGKVIAMVGGRGTQGSKLFNRATSPRQPGSSIKPLSVYGAALQKSFEYAQEGKTWPLEDFHYDKQGTTGWGDYITASSYVKDEKMIIGGEIWPYNFTRKFSGNCTFRKALQQSINTCAVKIQLQVGADYSAEMLEKFGLTTVVTDTTQPVNDLNPAAMALGAMSYGVTPLEMSLAYAVFPNGGVLNSPVCYKKVTDAEGNVIIEGKTKETQVLDEGVAWIMTDLLQSVVSRGIAGNASIWGTQVGGKTGTTNDCYDIWFDGFTPKYAAALWIGTDQNHEMATTSSTAALLWSTIMRQVPDATDGEYKTMPGNVTVQRGEYYTKGTEPSSYYTPPSNKSRRNNNSDDDDDDSNSSDHTNSGNNGSSGRSSGSGSSSVNPSSGGDSFIWEDID